ncbi:MAG: thioredoxin family protein [Candidatus Micrarchaeia archaeon]
MTIVKIFWQEECPNCPQAKNLGKTLEEEGAKVEYHNVKEVDGLSEAVFHDVMSTPSFVVTDGQNQLALWRSTTPSFEDVKKYL